MGVILRILAGIISIYNVIKFTNEKDTDKAMRHGIWGIIFLIYNAMLL